MEENKRPDIDIEISVEADPETQRKMDARKKRNRRAANAAALFTVGGLAAIALTVPLALLGLEAASAVCIIAAVVCFYGFFTAAVSMDIHWF